VIGQDAFPCASVVAEQLLLPSSNRIDSPETGAGGLAERSANEATTVTSCPGIPLLGLALSVRKVTSWPAPQVTCTELEATGVPLTVANAVTLSTP